MRRKSLIHGMSMEDVVVDAVVNRVLSKDRAIKKFAMKYKLSHPEFAGWVMFLANKIEAVRDELLKLPPKERSARTQDIVAEAAKEWRMMSDDEKKKWIESAKSLLAAEKGKMQEAAKFADEIEKLANEAVQAIEELATVIS